jgi:hypothetical protein
MNSISLAPVAQPRRRDDCRVAAFQRVDDLVGRRRAGVGRRRDRANDADRPRDLDDSGRREIGDHADRLRAVQVTQQAERLAVVLRDLVGDVADAGVGDRELGERTVAGRLDDRPAGRGDQLVDAGLVVALGEALRRAGAPHQIADARRHLGRRAGSGMVHRRSLR